MYAHNKRHFKLSSNFMITVAVSSLINLRGLTSHKKGRFMETSIINRPFPYKTICDHS